MHASLSTRNHKVV